jgi:putative FmdB family regulatory protein
MPLYEYECDACGHRFEVNQRFSDAPPAGCPVCGGAVRKRQSAPAFQFKGSGWYVTDYARKESAAPKEDEAKPADAKGADVKGGDARAGSAKDGKAAGGSAAETKAGGDKPAASSGTQPGSAAPPATDTKAS